MNLIYQVFGIGIAGALGSLARFSISCGATSLWGTSYPWGTTFVNILGSFLFGFISAWVAHGYLSEHWKVILLTGFLGGFTTFSAFAYENQQFFIQRRWNALTFHLVIQNILGILAVFLSLFLADLFFPSSTSSQS